MDFDQTCNIDPLWGEDGHVKFWSQMIKVTGDYMQVKAHSTRHIKLDHLVLGDLFFFQLIQLETEKVSKLALLSFT